MDKINAALMKRSRAKSMSSVEVHQPGGDLAGAAPEDPAAGEADADAAVADAADSSAVVWDAEDKWSDEEDCPAPVRPIRCSIASLHP